MFSDPILNRVRNMAWKKLIIYFSYIIRTFKFCAQNYGKISASYTEIIPVVLVADFIYNGVKENVCVNVSIFSF